MIRANRVKLIVRLAPAAILLGCGGTSTAPGTDEIPSSAATTPGTPNGTSITATIGPAGGNLASEDGSFSLVVPAGALATETAITIQPITNTAWGGIGGAYQLLPEGLTFSTPVSLVFEIAPEALEGSGPEFLDVATQSEQGFWYVLKDRTFDDASRKLTARTSHFSVYAALQNAYITPATAAVDVGGTVLLAVHYCFSQTVQNPNAGWVLISCADDRDLVPLDANRYSNWSVNGVSGGNTTVGRVRSQSASSGVATYTAPAAVPSSNPVAVSVRIRIGRGYGLLVSRIAVGAQWVGTATVYYGGSGGGPLEADRADFNLTWTISQTAGKIQILEPAGTVTYKVYSDPNCPEVRFAPNSATVGANDGELFIDYSKTPPTFSLTVAKQWSAQYFYQCAGHPVQGGDIPVKASLSVGETQLKDNGRKIEDHWVNQSDPSDHYDFVFTPKTSSGPSGPAGSGAFAAAIPQPDRNDGGRVWADVAWPGLHANGFGWRAPDPGQPWRNLAQPVPSTR